MALPDKIEKTIRSLKSASITKMAKMRPKMAKMKPKMAKMRPKMAKMRPKIAKMRPKMCTPVPFPTPHLP